ESNVDGHERPSYYSPPSGHRIADHTFERRALASRRITAVTTMASNDPAHSTIAPVRKCDAAENEIPRPVAAATYAARQAGHFGKSARMAAGKTQPAAFRQGRPRFGVFGACRPSQQPLIVGLLRMAARSRRR